MSRRKSRYSRRKEKRRIKKLRLSQHDNFENFAKCSHLYNMGKKAGNGVRFKASVQKYELNILFKTLRSHRKLILGEKVLLGFIKFILIERGKPRKISALRFPERVIQKALCNSSLYPVLHNIVIYDNFASQKGKGVSFARQRFLKHLHKFCRKHKNNGYILLIDFKNYYETLSHKILKDILYSNFTDKRIIKITEEFINAFGTEGLGLGSETSQVCGILHINYIDHYIKEQERIKFYGRYVDDSYIIHEDKEYLKELLNKLQNLYTEYGITINTKKSCIVPLKNYFTFLKTRFFVTPTGRVIKKPCKSSIVRERRKLKRQFNLYYKGILSLKEITQSYESWKSSVKSKGSRRTLYNMDKLFDNLKERGKLHESRTTI